MKLFNRILVRVRQGFMTALFCFIFLTSASVLAQGYASDKLSIIKMFKGQTPVAQANMTIHEPCGNPRTPNCGKPVQGMFSLGDGRKFNSGTAFSANEDYTVMIKANGSVTTIGPGSTNTIRVNNGNEVHNPNGVVRILAEKSRDQTKSIIIKGKNVSAKMRTTEFWVNSNAERTTFTPIEGTIYIVEKIPVGINYEPFKEQTDNRKNPRTATFPRTSTLSAGQNPYETGQLGYQNYTSVQDAIDSLVALLQENSNQMLDDELADTYLLLGEFYLDQDQTENAIVCFTNAVNYNLQFDPYSFETYESRLFLAEAQLDSNDDSVYQTAKNALGQLKKELAVVFSFYKEEYDYAKAVDDRQLLDANCQDLYDAADFMAWCLDLKDEIQNANKYYKFSRTLNCAY